MTVEIMITEKMNISASLCYKYSSLDGQRGYYDICEDVHSEAVGSPNNNNKTNQSPKEFHQNQNLDHCVGSVSTILLQKHIVTSSIIALIHFLSILSLSVVWTGTYPRLWYRPTRVRERQHVHTHKKTLLLTPCEQPCRAVKHSETNSH